MFTLADALLFRPLPVRAPHRLLRIDSVDASDASRRPKGVVASTVDALRSAHVFAGVCGFVTPLTTVDIDGRIASVSGVAMSGDCFETLGVHAALGRLLSQRDDDESAPRVIAISDDSWRQDFGGRPDVLERTIGIDGEPFRIVGVVERRFTGLLLGFPARVYFPLRQIKLPPDLSYASLGLSVFTRLRDGDTAASVAARLDAEWPAWLAAAIPARFSGADRKRYLERRPLVTSAATGIDYSLRSRFGQPLTALVAIASLVLLVAAINVANLLLARATDRRRDTAVRLALGATRWQIAQRVLLESGIVLVVAVAAGLLVAYWCDRLLVAMFQATSAGFTVDVAPDARALAFAGAAASLTFLVFALGPALKSADVDITAFQSASTRTTGERGSARRAILVAQVAMTLVLVAVGSVFVNALASLRSSPLGVDVEHVLALQLAALPGGYANGAAPTSYYRTLVERVQNLPGVTSVSLSADTPFLMAAPRPVDVAVVNPEAPPVSAEEKIITDRFFETMRIPLIAGEDFRPSDAEQSDRTVIVSASLSQRLFGSDSALARRICIGTKPELQAVRIVGVARDAVLSRPQARNTLIVYENWWQAPILFPTLVLRTRVEPVTVTAGVRDELRREGREFPERISTLEQTFDGAVAQERLLASVSASFSGLTLALAAVGLYGLLTFTVASRTNEIGVRMALGASRFGILRLVVRDAAVMVGTGVAIGVPLAWFAAKTASRIVFGTQVSELMPIGAAVGLLLVIGAIAASAPAVRATAVNPVDALRRE
jgi:predicted permease